MEEAGRLAGRRASELAEWARSSSPLACAVALATLNALTDAPPEAIEADQLTELRITSRDVIGMVGYFGPLVEPLHSRAKALHIFERRSGVATDVLPEAAAAQMLPQCDVVILSATTLINRTLDNLLCLSRNAHEVAILGPSTPLCRLPNYAAPAILCRDPPAFRWSLTRHNNIASPDWQQCQL
jgi:uncharacterized protein